MAAWGIGAAFPEDRGKIGTILMHRLGQWLLLCSIIGYFRAPAADMGQRTGGDQKLSSYSK